MGSRGSGSGKSSSKSSGGAKAAQMKKSVLSDEDVEKFYDYDDYAGDLASLMEGKSVYTLDYNGNKAFADITYDAKPDTLFVNYLASTGGGSGTELLTQLAERASSKGLALEWVADENSAKQYYNHLGVQSFGSVQQLGKLVNTRYHISSNKVQDFVSHLRNKKKK